jgi:hypothetical protein
MVPWREITILIWSIFVKSKHYRFAFLQRPNFLVGLAEESGRDLAALLFILVSVIFLQRPNFFGWTGRRVLAGPGSSVLF